MYVCWTPDQTVMFGALFFFAIVMTEHNGNSYSQWDWIIPHGSPHKAKALDRAADGNVFRPSIGTRPLVCRNLFYSERAATSITKCEVICGKKKHMVHFSIILVCDYSVR